MRKVLNFLCKTSSSSERLFSSAGYQVWKRRKTISPEKVEKIIPVFLDGLDRSSWTGLSRTSQKKYQEQEKIKLEEENVAHKLTMFADDLSLPL
ncbi:hypothetical protein BpHYR1_051226 [Brachionus plicatilis]|uniref:HAT C-terminal dimerisation domain-containing protein n=1 Tax=Brachionus plicatilis TaxID=10195 RepID=A0A3M7SXT8_BRAPC|nr:hypothetical protein BpHYR1_051226 [Brachionus plicatilis]